MAAQQEDRGIHSVIKPPVLSCGGQPEGTAVRGRARPLAALGLGSFRNLPMAEIRRAIVLNEVLGPPLAIRGPEQIWDRF